MELNNLAFGTTLTAAAAAINSGLGAYLVLLGRRKNSLILTSNGKHVLTDCWTSIAVLVGLVLVLTTKWLSFDPICGMIMAGNILWSGVGLMKSAYVGLMDHADPVADAKIIEILNRETKTRGLEYHHLRHRNLGDAHWVEVHLLFPEGASLKDAHRIATEVEQKIETALEQRAHVNTHLECASDHAALHPHETFGKKMTSLPGFLTIERLTVP